MTTRTFFFAGGGTGGHLYPALAVAEQLQCLDPDADIRFLCSARPIDREILAKTPYPFTLLPAQGFSWHPRRIVLFLRTFFYSVTVAREELHSAAPAIVIGIGGFVSSPVCWAARRMGVPIVLINVDITAGKANQLNARWAQQIFVQFEDTLACFRRFKAKVHAVGCPLRTAFECPNTQAVIDELQLDPKKYVLVITGASSGCQSLNEAVKMILPNLESYADQWQIVHLTGTRHFDEIVRNSSSTKITYKPVAYYDRMADLLAAADLVVGRSGAVSVAEYARAGVPSICLPYPHHKDRHQYLNAAQLVQVGAAIMVDDLPDLIDRSEWLWEELEPLLYSKDQRESMTAACAEVSRPDAARVIAESLLAMTESGKSGN